MTERCQICCRDLDEDEMLRTCTGSICRECVNEMCVSDLAELAGDDDLQDFAERLFEFICDGGSL